MFSSFKLISYGVLKLKNNVYFWRHTTQAVPKFSRYLEKINLLCQDETDDLDIEKLRGAESLFCLKLDYAARLIFTYRQFTNEVQFYS